MDKICSAWAHGRAYLADHPEGLRSAEILLQHALNVSRTHLYTHSEQPLSSHQIARYTALLEQRRNGMPIAYLTGQRSFWTFDVHVTPDTLIPRSETELLVECILDMTDPDAIYRVLDLGTGSGAIALALASERPHWHITASDLSKPALAIAEYNARILDLSSIRFVLSDWLHAFSNQQFDIIVANPPYLAAHDAHLQQGDLRFEPHTALASGVDGLDDLRIIIQQGYAHVADHGMLIVEHGYNQGDAVKNLFTQYAYQAIQTWRDTQHHPRVCCGKKTL